MTLGVAFEGGNRAILQAGNFNGGRGNDFISYLVNGNFFATPPSVSGYETEV